MEGEGVKTVGESASSTASDEGLAPASDAVGRVAASARGDGEGAVARDDVTSLASKTPPHLSQAAQSLPRYIRAEPFRLLGLQARLDV